MTGLMTLIHTRTLNRTIKFIGNDHGNNLQSSLMAPSGEYFEVGLMCIKCGIVNCR